VIPTVVAAGVLGPAGAAAGVQAGPACLPVTARPAGHLVACRPRACRARPASFPGRGGRHAAAGAGGWCRGAFRNWKDDDA
jgi:hypothetical protein